MMWLDMLRTPMAAPETPRLGERREVGFFLRYAHPVISVEDPNEWRTSRVTRINFSDRARQPPRASNVPATRAAPSFTASLCRP